MYNEENIIPTIEEAKEIIKNTKHANIDVKETIFKTVRSGWMEENYFVSLTDGNYLFDAMEMEDIEYNFLGEGYFEFINEKIEDDGIYIALGYATPENGGCVNPKEGEEGTGICTWKDDMDICLPEDAILGDMTTDYGIQVFKKDDEFEIIFSFNDSITFGHAMGYRKISSIENQLDEPLHRILIKMMRDAIIFEE